MLWGRVTYEMMESYWPAVARGEVEALPAVRAWAVKLEAKAKYVVSSTRTDFPWTHSHHIAGALREGVQALKDATPDGVLLGSGMLATDLLLAAAGFGSAGALVDLPIAEELSMIDLNCRVVTELCHHFGTRFAQKRSGGLVLMSSLLAFQGVPRAATYAATKAYVQTLAEGLRAELAPSGVDVIASAPGPIRSGFEAREDGDGHGHGSGGRRCCDAAGARTENDRATRVAVQAPRGVPFAPASDGAGAHHGEGDGRHDPPPHCGTPGRAEAGSGITSALTPG